MPKITFIDSSGTARTVDAELGSTVMETAIRNNIPGIEAECGGSCSCGTCHVYVEEARIATLPAPDANEVAILDFVAAEVKPESRLACQIKVTPELDAMVVRVPAAR